MQQDYSGENLIFIISQPRSGSTLLQRLLSGHQDIQTAAETWLMLHPVYANKPDKVFTEYNSIWAHKAVEDFLNNYAMGPEIYDAGIREFANRIYGDVLAKSGKHYFLDKTPRYFFIIPDLYRLFPEARFIFLLRNPIAVLYSELNTYVKGNWPVLGLFAPDLLLAPKLISEGIDLLGDAGHVIHYEELVTNPEHYMMKLCGYLGIQFTESMINYENTPAPVGLMNDPIGIHKHTRPTDKSVEKWKILAENPQYLHFAKSYQASLGEELLGKLGYSYDDIQDTLNETTTSNNSSDKSIFPWSIAIRSEEDWTLRERYFKERFFAIEKKGLIRGTISSLRGFIRIERRKLMNQLRMQEPSKCV